MMAENLWAINTKGRIRHMSASVWWGCGLHANCCYFWAANKRAYFVGIFLFLSSCAQFTHLLLFLSCAFLLSASGYGHSSCAFPTSLSGVQELDWPATRLMHGCWTCACRTSPTFTGVWSQLIPKHLSFCTAACCW